jgi:hypothetical protein
MVDELRDYRWYDDDLIHPSKPARAFILQRVFDKFLTPETIDACNEVAKLNKNISHKPSSEGLKSFHTHVTSTAKLIQRLQQRYPSVDLRAQAEWVKAKQKSA